MADWGKGGHQERPKHGFILLVVDPLPDAYAFQGHQNPSELQIF